MRAPYTHMLVLLLPGIASPIPEKVLNDTFTKTGTWWELNTHCSGWRRYNHITRIKPFAKYPMFGGVTANCRGSMTRKVLTRQVNGKSGIGGI